MSAAKCQNATASSHFATRSLAFITDNTTNALLDRLTYHVNILEMNGESYRLGQSRARKTDANA